MDFLSQNTTLKNVSRARYGDDLTLMTVNSHTLRRLPAHARMIETDAFRQLADRVRRDKKLSRMPVCCRYGGLLYLLSGHAQVNTCIQAADDHIMVVVIEKDVAMAHDSPPCPPNTPDDLALLRAALPPGLPLDLVPTDVARAYLLWRGIPVCFSKFHDANGDSVGFSWDYDHAWRRKHPERFEAFWRFQDKSSALWEWMSDHPTMKITSQNLLHIWG